MRSAGQRAAFSLVALFLATVAVVGAPSTNQSNQAPAELVRRAVHNEIASNQNSGVHYMFKDERKTPQLSQTKLLVETQEATAGLLLMQNGKPLSPQERQAEEARLANYVQNSAELHRKRKQERDDAEHTERILRALPDAFLYERDGTRPSREGVGHIGDELVQLNFRPNPDYNPPSHVEQVLTGMRGHVLIDPVQERIAEIDGTLEREVGFGWGILGHLNPGGRFLVRQAEIGDHQWEVTQMELSFTGKVLFVKKLNIHSSDTFSDFRQVPSDLTFAQGVELLKKEAAENHSSTAPLEANRNAAARNKADTKNRTDQPLCCDP